MIKKNLIESKRQFEIIAKITKSDYLKTRKYLSNKILYNNKGYLVFEKTSIFLIKNKVKN